MVYHFKKQVSTAGTAVPIATVSIPVSWVLFYPAKSDGTANAGQVRIGGYVRSLSSPILTTPATPPTSIPAGTGAPLNAGASNLVWNAQATNPFDLSQIFIDADTSGDGVQGIYGTV